MNENIEFEKLRRIFKSKFQKSEDKNVLLKREIKGYSLIFDEDNLKISILSNEDEPLGEYSIGYSSMQIWLIREFYIHFIVEGNEISDIENDEWDSWIRKLYEFAQDNLPYIKGPKFYYNLARGLHLYIKWLEDQVSTLGKNRLNITLEAEKEYKSLNRAFAFCLMKMHQEGKISYDIMSSKTKITRLFDKEFPEHAKNTSRIVYEELKCRDIYHNLKEQIIEHKSDYEYGIKLYKEKYPD